MPKSVYIETYGCQMNRLDSEILGGVLLSEGHKLVETPEDAEVILVNTCSVRKHAEQRVLGRLAQLHRLRQHRPRLILGVVGCMAQRMGASIADEVPDVDLIAGPDAYRRLPAMLEACSEDLYEGEGPQVDRTLDPSENYEGIMPCRAEGPKGWIAITRGCDNFCTYCIVPYIRGRMRSRSWREILREARALAARGGVEATLLGQNVNAYRDADVSFADLLRLLDREADLPRIRFLTSHPKDLSDDILEAISACPSICEHLHLPVQSGSTRILRAMRRGYTAEHYTDMVDRARRVVPGLSLTTDVIAGFPGETEEDFRSTVSLMERTAFDYAFTYRYSPRSGTLATELQDDVPSEEKARRLETLIELQQRITKRRHLEMIGSEEEVLVEGISRRDAGQFLTRTRTDKPVVIDNPSGRLRIGDMVRVRIIGVNGNTPVGESSVGARGQGGIGTWKCEGIGAWERGRKRIRESLPCPLAGLTHRA